jgi:hypothetical protein
VPFAGRGGGMELGCFQFADDAHGRLRHAERACYFLPPLARGGRGGSRDMVCTARNCLSFRRTALPGRLSFP